MPAHATWTLQASANHYVISDINIDINSQDNSFEYTVYSYQNVMHKNTATESLTLLSDSSVCKVLCYNILCSCFISLYKLHAFVNCYSGGKSGNLSMYYRHIYDDGDDNYDTDSKNKNVTNNNKAKKAEHAEIFCM